MDTDICNEDLIPLAQIKNKLVSLCQSGGDADIWLFTDDQHTAIISVQHGEIVGLRYCVSRGIDALSKIQSIARAKIKLHPVEFNAGTSKSLPSTDEILNAL